MEVVLGQSILCFLHKFSGQARVGNNNNRQRGHVHVLKEGEEGRKRSHAKTITHTHCTASGSALMAANRGIHCGFDLQESIPFLFMFD